MQFHSDTSWSPFFERTFQLSADCPPIHFRTKMPQAEVQTRRPSQGEETLDVNSAQKSSEGETEAVDPMESVVTRSVIETIIKAYDPSLTVTDFSGEPGSAAGDNYVAVMYALKVNVTKKGSSDNVVTHNIMLKTMPLNPARVQMANESKVFVKEALMYGTVFRDLDQFQKDLGLSKNEIYTDYPFCYATLVDGKADHLAMENLKATGFVMADRMKGLDRQHATVVMKSLARFHALTYVKFRGSFQAILEAYPQLEDVVWSETAASGQSDMMKMFVSHSMKNVIKSLRTAGYESEVSILEGPKFTMEAIMEQMRRCSAVPCKYAVIGHSDAWTNNMLFKYDTETGQPIGVKLIDFQLSHPCSRTLDLMYFLSGCLVEELSNVSEQEFLRIYYDEFATFTKRLGFFEKELTFEQLLNEFEEYRYFGIIMACIAVPIFYANKEDAKNLEEVRGEFTEEAAAEFFGGMTNITGVRRLKNILNAQVPKLNL